MNFSTFLKIVFSGVIFISLISNIFAQDDFVFQLSTGKGSGDDCDSLNLVANTISKRVLITFTPDPNWNQTNYTVKIYVYAGSSQANPILPVSSANTYPLCGPNCIEVPFPVAPSGGNTIGVTIQFHHLGACNYTLVAELMGDFYYESSNNIFTSLHFWTCHCESISGPYSGLYENGETSGPNRVKNPNILDEEALVSPNPFSSETTLMVPNKKELKKVELINQMGRKLFVIEQASLEYSSNSNSFNKRMRLDYLPSGIYYLRLWGLHQNKVIKIIKIE